MLQSHAEQLALLIVSSSDPQTTQDSFGQWSSKAKPQWQQEEKVLSFFFKKCQRRSNHAFKHEFGLGTLCACLNREESHFPMICRKWKKFQHKHRWFIYHIILRLLSQARKHGCASKVLTDTRRKMRTQLSKWWERRSGGIMEFFLKTPYRNEHSVLELWPIHTAGVVSHLYELARS